jgi:uncharacterized protein YyaL (SSP411 family)
LHWGLLHDNVAFVAASLGLAQQARASFGEQAWPGSLGDGELDRHLGKPQAAQDGQQPAAQAVALEWLLELAAVSGDESWREACDQILHQASGAMTRYPTMHKDLWRVFHRAVNGLGLVILHGATTEAWFGPLLGRSQPDLLWIRPKVSQWLAEQGAASLQERPAGRAYYCQGSVCQQPAGSLSELAQQLPPPLPVKIASSPTDQET